MSRGGSWGRRLRTAVTLVRFSGLQLFGRRSWLLVLLPLAWLAFQALMLVLSQDRSSFGPAAAQNALIGLPLVVLGILLGVRVIAGELDRRSLEIAYTVPGGAHRIWLAKLAAAMGLLLVAELLLAAVTYAFFTPFPVVSALYGAFQAAVTYLVLAMGLAALARSEVAGIMLSSILLFINGLITGYGSTQLRISPFWNSEALRGIDSAQVAAWTLQNRIGFLLIIAALTGLAFLRAERREKMLAG